MNKFRAKVRWSDSDTFSKLNTKQFFHKIVKIERQVRFTQDDCDLLGN